MTQCDQCGREADELWAVGGEFGRTDWVCDDCAPKPALLDVTGQRGLRCPSCRSAGYKDVSKDYWFHREGGLFLCEHGHLFTARRIGKRTVTEEVRIPDD